MKIAVGTTSKWKIKFLADVLNEMGVEAEVETYDVESGVPDQPIGEDIVIQGSVNRAKASWDKSEGCDFAIGVEFGYRKDRDNIYLMFCYATVMNENNEVTKKSSELELPIFFQDLLKRGESLGEFTKEYEQRDHHPSSLYLARLVRFREPFIKEAIRNSLLIFLHPEEF